MTRTYVVTGAASGIGEATKAQLEAQGHRVIGVDLHDADVVADLSTPEGRAAMVEGVREATGGVVDAVIAGAGISLFEPLTVKVNYFGAIATLEGLRPMLARGTDPRAVVISSVASIQDTDPDVVEACLAGDEDAAVAAAADASWYCYSSSKAAVARWVRRNAPTESWAGAGIPLNAIGPGVIETPMTRDLLADPEGAKLADDAVPMPLGGHAQAVDVAELLVWLASPANTKVTGQVIFIDGGADAVTRGDSVW